MGGCYKINIKIGLVLNQLLARTMTPKVDTHMVGVYTGSIERKHSLDEGPVTQGFCSNNPDGCLFGVCFFFSCMQPSLGPLPDKPCPEGCDLPIWPGDALQ